MLSTKLGTWWGCGHLYARHLEALLWYLWSGRGLQGEEELWYLWSGRGEEGSGTFGVGGAYKWEEERKLYHIRGGKE